MVPDNRDSGSHRVPVARKAKKCADDGCYGVLLSWLNLLRQQNLHSPGWWPGNRKYYSKLILKATKSEAQTTSSGRSRNGRGGMLHHRHLNENNNQVNRHTVKTSMQNWWHPFCPQSFLRLTTGIIPSVQLIPRCPRPLEITVWCWLKTILLAVATQPQVVATRP